MVPDVSRQCSGLIFEGLKVKFGASVGYLTAKFSVFALLFAQFVKFNKMCVEGYPKVNVVRSIPVH